MRHDSFSGICDTWIKVEPPQLDCFPGHIQLSCFFSKTHVLLAMTLPAPLLRRTCVYQNFKVIFCKTHNASQ